MTSAPSRQVADTIEVAGPWYEDLRRGHRFDAAPAVTLTDGQAALHQAIVGDRLRLPLDADLSARVCGGTRPVAHPGLVCDVAVGQSTQATQRVVANVFYRGVVLHRLPRLGDTLRTVTEVVALRDTRARAGRPPTGLAVLRVRTVDAEDRLVLDFHRCAMLPMRDERYRPGHADDLEAISDELSPELLSASIDGWNLEAFRALVPGPHGDGLRSGARYVIDHGDTVTAAPELVRLTLNVAAAHSDAAAGRRGRRLVYGGHTIGVALAHLTRALPNVLTVVGWHACDHLAPVFEGDVLRSAVDVVSIAPLPRPDGGSLVELRVMTTAEPSTGDAETVLDWRLVAAMA